MQIKKRMTVKKHHILFIPKKKHDHMIICESMMIKVKDEWLFDEAVANPLVTIPNEKGHLGGTAARSCW